MNALTAEQLIRDAIASKRPMYAVYDGCKRYFCPHVLGYKEHRLQVLVYLYAGESMSKGAIATPPDPSDGPPQNWRCLEVADLRDLAIIEGPWYTCRRHTQPQTCADTVLAEVAPA